MRKPKLTLFVFITFLIGSLELTAMNKVNQPRKSGVLMTDINPQPSSSQKPIDKQTNRSKRGRRVKRRTAQLKCSICDNEYAKEILHQLTCGHQFCKSCLSRYLATQFKNDVIPTCPSCGKIFVSQEYEAITFNRTLAVILKNKYFSRENEFYEQNLHHRTLNLTLLKSRGFLLHLAD